MTKTNKSLCERQNAKLAKGISLAVQWLGPGTFTASGLGSVPGKGTKILQAAWCGQ